MSDEVGKPRKRKPAEQSGGTGTEITLKVISVPDLKNNSINGRDYCDFAWLPELSAGYLQDLGPLFVAVQGGYLVGVYTNIGPRKDPDRFVTGKVLVGVAFWAPPRCTLQSSAGPGFLRAAIRC